MSLEPLSNPQPNALMRYLARFDDGEVMRWAFRGLLLGAIGVLAMDMRDLVERNGAFFPAGKTEVVAPAELRVLPPAVRPQDGGKMPSADPRRNVTLDEEGLRQPIAFTLKPGGVLLAEGSIDPGAAARFATEMAARGEYVKIVSLNSPGGALEDAMAMARLVREKGLATQVADGALCASSCPLLLAGGKVRRVGAKAAVGVHQFYAASAPSSGPAQAMSDAQATTARISRHLAEMGVDPALWLHALDTPPQALYYLSPEELSRYRLVTSGSSPVAMR